MQRLLMLMLLAGCERLRDRPEESRCVTWEGEVEVLLEQHCSTCHSGARPAGGLDMTSYPRVLEAELLAELDPARADEVHQPVSAVFEDLDEWVACGSPLRHSLIHASGIQNPTDPEFHGELVRSTGYDFARCAECHGADFEGGGARSSCVRCHQAGPTACETCHPPAMDAEHRAHPFDCARCHRVPSDWTEIGHVLLADGAVDPEPAEVTLPGWDGVRCSDACHGTALPTWEAGLDQARCGTCHGLPPPDHASDRCGDCHQRSSDGAGSLHNDGLVQVGRTDEGCRGCHGTPEAPAPPPSLSGSSERAVLEVGAHRAHLEPQLGLRGPMSCGDCHLVPETLERAGHLDSALPAEIFPVAIRAASLAFNGTEASWDRERATCISYCHGDARPIWNQLQDQVTCGSCHPIPPVDLTHDPAWEVFECARCHEAAVDPFGNPIPSEHLDGNVD